MEKSVAVHLEKPKIRTERKSIIVVLGMHRSGTSAITRGLMALGVELGDRLMPAAPNNNEKGFFEDVDVNSINTELYKSLGNGQDWHTLAPIPREELLHEKNTAIRLRAIELLRSRLQNTDCFGLKDPRICRFLPFWQSVFEYLQLDASYIIIVRNPLSVAESLRKRDNLPPEKCHYLWLDHLLSSTLLTEGTSRVLVDYDLLLEDPQKQITRIAQALGLVNQIDSARLLDFSQDFLEDRLRHTNFKPEDVFQDPIVPIPVSLAAALFANVARDKLSLDSEDVARALVNLSRQMEGMSQAMSYLLQLDNIIVSLNQTLASRDNRIGILSQNISKCDAQLVILTRAMHDKDRHILNLDKAATEREDRIEALTQAADEREAQLAILTRAVHDKDRHILNLDKAAVEREGRIEALTHATTQKDYELQQLNVTTVQLNYRLLQAHTSFGWKFFKAARLIKNSLARFSQQSAVNLIPLSQLRHNGIGWSSAENDAQFLLMVERSWQRFTGWHLLDASLIMEQPLNARLYFDLGKGFDLSHTINILFAGKGTQRIPLFVPPSCRAIKFELRDVPTQFKFAVLGLKKLKQAPELPEEFLAQSTVYEALGGRQGNVSYLEPLSDIQRHRDVDYCWYSKGTDPSFELKSIGKKLRPGWYLIELRIRLNTDRGSAKLYFDYDKGYSESTAVTLPFSNGQLAKRLFHLPAIPRHTRFDPIETAAKFSVERLNFAAVSPIFARRHMLKYLGNHYTRHKGQSTAYIWRDLQALARKRKTATKELLYQRYNESFSAEGLHNRITYAEWIDRFEAPLFSDIANIEAVRKSLKHEPTISVLMPVYNTAETFLRQAIESVLAQSYPLWRLCIADDASPKPHVRRVLKEYVERDPRIQVVFRSENGHISAASNSALALATGEYVALMDHDDELANHALLFMVEAINRHPSAQVLYSDEDKIDELRNRFEPHFKPDWNPDLFFSQNYVSHLGVFRRELLDHIGGFRMGVEGSQDQDLLLRCIPHVNSTQIVHIPKVLYHWRVVDGSTALASGEKSYTSKAGIKALRDFFSSQNRGDVKVEAGFLPNTYRVRYPLPQPEPLVSLLIPTRDTLEMLAPCVQSVLEKTTYPNYEIIILDNDSAQAATHRYFERIQTEQTRVRVLPYPHPFNFSAINNYGVKHAKGEVIGLLNNDIRVINPEWLSEMMSHALRPEIGCVGAKLYYEDETIQHAGVIVGLGGVAGHSHKYFPRAAPGYFSRLKIVQNLSAVTAACLAVRKSIYEQVGGFEETGLSVAFNDVDFCLKVREAGYRNLWTPYAELYHYESKSRGTEDTPEKKVRFNSETTFIKSKWGELLGRDPCYSEHLTLKREDFSIGG